MSTRGDHPGRPDHVDVDTLADHLEGLLDSDDAARVDRHLAGCDVCAGRVEDLRGVSRLLSSQPAPPMPAHVQERLQQALEAEVAASEIPDDRAAAPASGSAAAPVSSLDRARRRRTRLSRALLGAAAAVAVVAVGGVVVSEIGSGGSTAESSGQAGGMTTAERPQRESAPERAPDSGDVGGSPGAGVAPRVERQPSLIEEIYRTRTVTVQRERESCVGSAVGDPQWVGTSYAVDLDGKPGVVAFLGDADNTARKTTGVLVECDAEPTVLRRQQLRR